MEIESYLARIKYDGPVLPGAESLKRLHRSHLFTVPFENLDIHTGNKIYLDLRSFYNKIVRRKRGGFCYELNGLFSWLLKELGYDVDLLSAGVFNNGRFGEEYDHLTLLVKLEDPWIADVGFGDSFLEPLRFKTDIVQEQQGVEYRFSNEGGKVLLSRRKINSKWEPLYIFSMVPRELWEFAGMCEFHQTSPETSFTKKKVCTIATGKGRTTLSDTGLIVTQDGKRLESSVADQNFPRLLKQYFGIQMENIKFTSPL